MSLSISSRPPSYRAPEPVIPSTPTFSAPTSAAADSSGSSDLMSSLLQDSFGADSASGYGDVTGAGGGMGDLAQMADQLIQTLEQLKDLLAPELGDESAPQGGQEAPGVEAGGPQSADGPQGTNGPQGTGDAGKAPEGQVGDWIKEAQKVLAANGVPADKMKAEDIAKIIEHESSGNPNAVNNWDQNAKDGHPSKGLMQTIDSTFNAYKAPGHDDVFNPVDNIVAAVRYSVDKYGSVSNVPGLQAMNGGGGYVGY